MSDPISDALGETPLPRGFVPVDLVDPFEIHLGQYYCRRSDAGGLEFALPLGAHHLNAMGAVHGGALMSFADAATGLAAWDAASGKALVTLTLTVTFQRSAKPTGLLTMAPRITWQSRSVVFVDGELRQGDRLVAGVVSIWKAVAERPGGGPPPAWRPPA